MENIDKRNVVVTGASTGIGEACALRFDAMGFRVFAGVRKQADGDALKAKSSDTLTPLMLDVTDEATIAAAAKQVREATGDAGLAGLVNNAGISVNAPLEFVPLDRMRHQLEVNVVGQVAVTQAFLPLLRKGKGRIINIGSIAGRMAMMLGGPYSASKFAMEAITDSLRLELKPWGIEVIIVEPGAIATPIWEKSMSAARTMVAEMPPQAKELYKPALRMVTNAAQSSARNAVPTDHVVHAVEHALTAAKPRTRYIVGKDARMQRLIAHLPDRLRDWIVHKYLARNLKPAPKRGARHYT